MKSHSNGARAGAFGQPVPASGERALMFLPASAISTAEIGGGLAIVLDNEIAKMTSPPLSVDGCQELIDRLTEWRRKAMGLIDPGAGRIVLPGSD